MRASIHSVKCAARRMWWGVRQIFGDAAYENYLRSFQRNAIHGGDVKLPLTQDEFYLDSLRRRYSQISRCC